MARTKKQSRRYYKKTSWESNLININGSQSATANNNYVIYENLATNPALTPTGITQKFTVKNVKLQVRATATDITSATNFDNFSVYILYVPEGYASAVPGDYANIPFNHPEWIMAYRYIGKPLPDTSTSFLPINISTRLARNLGSGDRIVFLLLGTNNDAFSHTINYKGLASFVTKAN